MWALFLICGSGILPAGRLRGGCSSRGGALRSALALKETCEEVESFVVSASPTDHATHDGMYAWTHTGTYYPALSLRNPKEEEEEEPNIWAEKPPNTPSASVEQHTKHKSEKVTALG